MSLNKLVFAIGLSALVFSCTTNVEEKPEKEEKETLLPSPTNQVKLSSEIRWEQLNPARGDKSPKAGTIWGDRKMGSQATGFIVKFVDGFSSPPHIHNVTYRALVLKGLVHNDDPDAKEMWMPVGSFWTQPAGEVHITSAKGEETMAYVEIDQAPYLVQPTEEAFDNGEQPINISYDNLVWLDASKTNLIQAKTGAKSPALSFLWKAKGKEGILLKLPNDFDGALLNKGSEFRAIVVGGTVEYIDRKAAAQSLDLGSSFSAQEASVHQLRAKGEEEILIYIRTNGEIFLR